METILFVEDEPVTLRAVSAALERNGFEVIGSETGENALEIINRGNRIDLVLLDIELMDGMDGLETAEAILSRHDIPVVFFSNHKDPDILEKVQNTASYGYVLKNSGIELLVMTVRNSLRLHGAHKKLKDYEAAIERKLEEHILSGNETAGYKFDLEALFNECTDELSDRVEKLLGLERILSEHEKNISTLTNNLPGMAYRCLNSPDYPMEFVSSGSFSLTGFYPAEFIKEQISMFDLIHPDDRIKIWDETRAAVSAGSDFQKIYRLFSKDNKVKWVMENGRGVFSADGELQYLEGFISDITELKNVEERLKQSESTARALLNNPAAAVVMMQPDGTVIDVNETVLAKYNINSEELKGRIIFDFHTDEVAIHRRDLTDKVVKSKQALRFTDRQSERWWDNILIPVFDYNGDVEKIIVWSYDVSEIKKIEEALRLSEERFRVIFEKSPLGIIVTDRYGKIVKVNEEWLNMSGYNEQEMTGFSISDIFNLSGNPSVSMPLELLFTHKLEFLRAEFQFFKKNRSICWGELSARVYSDPGNGLPYAMIKILDISDRKLVERALEETEEKERILIEECPLPIFASKKGKIFFTNRAFTQLFGYDNTDEIIGTPFPDYVAAADKEKVTDITSRSSGGTAMFESRGVRSDGSDFPFIANIVPIYQIDGPGTFAFIQDLSGKIETEEKLKSMNAELEQRVAERTEEIHKLNQLVMNSQEMERQRVARDLHDGVGQTILAAKLALNSFINTDTKDYSIIGKSINFIEMASQELREVYSGLYPSMLNELGLNLTIKWLIRNYLESSGISVSYTYEITGFINDNIQINLYRIIQEIFNNIIKYSAADFVNITFTEETDLIILYIDDDGKGFDVSKALAAASGAGLLNIRERVRNLNGLISIESEPGSTKIRIEIPSGEI